MVMHAVRQRRSARFTGSVKKLRSSPSAVKHASRGRSPAIGEQGKGPRTGREFSNAEPMIVLRKAALGLSGAADRCLLTWRETTERILRPVPA
ncbi:MAG: hypothetical protein JO069_19990 [Verrucomicrobia bacterium]|nr:hypothetical protein [Verrucomicrobiota bacterium]